MPEGHQWARVCGDANHQLRRGAWYQVLALTPEQAVLDVNHHPVLIPRSVVQISPARPYRWSVVRRPRDAISLPLSWGTRYAVCPSCTQRVSLRGSVSELSCPRCHGVFIVGWDDLGWDEAS
ncbi:MAG TPA: hypothetical protein VLV16_03220 [Gemmatimonadales bacterium]|nr:hypothetical protein [Gemmatimonadales bacterium]